MKKRIAAAMLAVVMAFGLTACGGGSASGTDSQSGQAGQAGTSGKTDGEGTDILVSGQ